MALTASHSAIPIGAVARATLATLAKPSIAQPVVKRAVAEHYRQTPIPERTGRLAASLRQQRGGEVRVTKDGVLVINRVPYALYVVRRFKIPDPDPDKLARAMGAALFDPRNASGSSAVVGAAPAPSLPVSSGGAP